MKPFLAAAALAFLAACNTPGGAPNLGSLVPSQPPADMGSGAAGVSPALGVPDLSGRVLDGAAVQGQVVLVDFWASWCGPCQQSTPFYRRMHDRFHGKGFMVLAVSMDEEKPALDGYLAVHPLPYNVVWDQDHALSNRFAVFQLPTAFLFDRKGRLRKTRTGFNAEETRAMEDEIRLLLSEPG